MKVIIRNFLAVITGLVLGSMVNMGLISISASVIAPPAGADVTNMAGLKATMHLFEPKHFLFPFLAHALGTFFGALVAGAIAATHKLKFAMAIGFVFLIGGIANIMMLPSPLWYSVVDLALAYLPMSYLAARLLLRNTHRNNAS